MSARVSESSAPNGSSSSSTRPFLHDGAQQRGALAHPARQLLGPRALEPGQPERREQRPRPARGPARLRTPATSSPSVVLSSTLRHGNSRSRCGM